MFVSIWVEVKMRGPCHVPVAAALSKAVPCSVCGNEHCRVQSISGTTQPFRKDIPELGPVCLCKYSYRQWLTTIECARCKLQAALSYRISGTRVKGHQQLRQWQLCAQCRKSAMGDVDSQNNNRNVAIKPCTDGIKSWGSFDKIDKVDDAEDDGSDNPSAVLCRGHVCHCPCCNSTFLFIQFSRRSPLCNYPTSRVPAKHLFRSKLLLLFFLSYMHTLQNMTVLWHAIFCICFHFQLSKLSAEADMSYYCHCTTTTKELIQMCSLEDDYLWVLKENWPSTM